ncbi:MAG: glycosyltransferase [Nitrospiraceae bacterium]|nr:glycosyltransferase [Nitrospiraceae bacterium]
MPFVTVIVPVYNDAGRIWKCIEALLRQTYPPDRYEIVVVDNGSTDETCSVIGRYPVTLLVENEKQTSYAARNRGVRLAKGKVIAMTDSDCIPQSDWIEKGVARLLGEPHCGLVGGKIEIFFKQRNKPNAVELYDSVTGFNQKDDIERHHFGSTANVFTYREVFDSVGLFNDGLKSGGDNEWGRRVFSSGYGLVYAEDAVVAHPARHSFGQLYRRATRLIGGCYEQYWKNSYRSCSREAFRSLRTIVSLTLRIALGLYPADRLNGIKRKCQYISVVSFVELVSTWERTRLLLGGKSRR